MHRMACSSVHLSFVFSSAAGTHITYLPKLRVDRGGCWLCDVSVTGAWGRIDDSVTAGVLGEAHAAEHSGWEYKTTYNNEIYSSSIRQRRQQEKQKCSEWAEIP